MTEEKKLTGYPSIDKPWLKYYSEEAINAKLPECTIYEYLWEKNKDRLDNTALNYFNNKITFKQMFENIDRVAKAFMGIGVKAGEIVTILSITTPEMVYSFYALNLIGAIANIVDPRTNIERIEKYINNTETQTVIVLDKFLFKLEELKHKKKIKNLITISASHSMPFIVKKIYQIKSGKVCIPQDVICWNEFLKYGLDNLSFKRQYKPNEDVVIVYTGGTTGIPKGVVLTNETFITIAEQCRNLSISYDDKRNFLNIMPPFIAYGIVFGLNMPLTLGLANVIIPVFKPEEFAKLVKKYKPLAIMGVPSHYETLVKSKCLKRFDLSFLEIAAAGGDAMNEKTEETVNLFFENHKCKYNVANGYGMTEIGSCAVSNHGNINKRGSVGVPHCKTIVSVFESGTDKELTYNDIGEICIHTPAIMKGYYKNDSETAKILMKHSDGKVWVHTNDIGHIDEDGFVFIKGRTKRMIIRPDGHNVFPSEIENVILEHEAVESCAVVGVKDIESINGKWPFAFIVLKEIYKNDNSIIESIKSYCDRKLPVRDTANYFVQINKLPVTNIGKVDFLKLEQMGEEYVNSL